MTRDVPLSYSGFGRHRVGNEGLRSVEFVPLHKFGSFDAVPFLAENTSTQALLLIVGGSIPIAAAPVGSDSVEYEFNTAHRSRYQTGLLLSCISLADLFIPVAWLSRARRLH